MCRICELNELATEAALAMHKVTVEHDTDAAEKGEPRSPTKVELNAVVLAMASVYRGIYLEYVERMGEAPSSPVDIIMTVAQSSKALDDVMLSRACSVAVKSLLVMYGYADGEEDPLANFAPVFDRDAGVTEDVCDKIDAQVAGIISGSGHGA